MASVIKDRTISSVQDKRIVLSNSNFARLWSSSLGTGWTKIRIACRTTIRDSGANATGTPKFAIGITSGTSNIFMDATTDHWLGVVSQLTTWTRNAGPPIYYAPGGGSYYQAAKKVASASLSGTAVITNFASAIFDCTTANRSAFMIDITKGSPNFSVQAVCVRNNTTSGDVDLTSFLTQLEVPSPALTNHTSYTAVNVAIDEAANGYFNGINIAWDRTTPEIEISDIAVVRLT